MDHFRSTLLLLVGRHLSPNPNAHHRTQNSVLFIVRSEKNKSLMYSFLERDVTDSGTLSAAATILHASQSAPNRPPARSRSIFFFIAFLWRRFVHSEEKRTEEYFSVRKARDYGVECSSLLHPLIPLHRAIAHGSSMPVTTNVNASNGKFVSFVHRLPIVFSRKCFKHPSSHIKSG